MAVRKRELTVEKWCAHEIEFGEWLAENPQQMIGMPDDLIDGTMGELLMTKGFKQCGM